MWSAARCGFAVTEATIWFAGHRLGRACGTVARSYCDKSNVGTEAFLPHGLRGIGSQHDSTASKLQFYDRFRVSIRSTRKPH
jgi:hypothetical protein